jgi:hypothetical protein
MFISATNVRFTVTKRLFQLLLLATLGGVASGCTAVGAIAYKLSPQPAVPAEYKPTKQTTLIMVENFRNPDLFEVESERLERDIGFAFTEQKLFPVVPVQKLLELKASDSASFSKMDIPGVARALGAKQVLYVELQQFSVDPPIASETMHGKVLAKVKMVDAETGETLWPRDSSIGHEVKYETPTVSGDDTRAAVQEKLYQRLSSQIAKLFYDAPVDEINGDEPDVSLHGPNNQ